jgi:cytochrome c biogenesis protein CcmG/thiol:disulfide interchange protein DsbE
MKSILIIISVFYSSISAFSQLPEIEVRDLDQNWISLSDLNGEELTVIDFWATWCKPCVTAIPKLNSLYTEFSKQGIEFVGINVDGPRNHSKVKPFVNTLNINYPIVLDPDQDLVNEYNVTAFPTLIIVNSKGEELFVHEGFNPGDEKLIRDELIKLLEK